MSLNRQVNYPVSPSPSATLKLGQQASSPSPPPIAESPKRFTRARMTGVVVDTIGMIGMFLHEWMALLNDPIGLSISPLDLD